MRSAPECFPCSINQALRTAQMAGLSEEFQRTVMLEAERALVGTDLAVPPAVIATAAIRATGELYQRGDPFLEMKIRTTEEALALYNAIKSDVTSKLSRMTPVERIRYCAKLAAAGNIIDFGVGTKFDLEKTLTQTLEGNLAFDDSERFYAAMTSSASLLLISDNAGEIVFDRPLMDEAIALGKRVYLAVKSGPILNDATLEDAERAGIGTPIEVIETGSSSLGMIFEECSEGFRELFWGAGVVLSKGQANYETLDESLRSVFFILRAKCPIVARRLDIPTDASVLMWNGVA